MSGSTQVRPWSTWAPVNYLLVSLEAEQYTHAVTAREHAAARISAGVDADGPQPLHLYSVQRGGGGGSAGAQVLPGDPPPALGSLEPDSGPDVTHGGTSRHTSRALGGVSRRGVEALRGVSRRTSRAPSVGNALRGRGGEGVQPGCALCRWSGVLELLSLQPQSPR